MLMPACLFDFSEVRIHPNPHETLRKVAADLPAQRLSGYDEDAIQNGKLVLLLLSF